MFYISADFVIIHHQKPRDNEVIYAILWMLMKDENCPKESNDLERASS